MPRNASGRGNRPSGTPEPRWQQKRISQIADHRRPMDQAADLEAAGPMGGDPMVPQEVHKQDGMLGLTDTQWSPACTHMATSDKEDTRVADGAHTHIHSDDHWSPACTHMSTPEDKCNHGARVQDFLADLSDAESVLEFLLDFTKIHDWADGSEIRGRAGFGVFFSHAEYDNINEPVVGAQINNRVEVSAVRAEIRAVRSNTQELCLYSDSKWCLDIFSNLQLYKHRAWMAKGKQPVRYHDI